MITQEQSQPQPPGFMHWLKESVTVKLTFIAVLILVLLIPQALIDGLIHERSSRQDQAIKTVSDQYSGEQLIQGPVLVIPYREQVTETDAQGKQQTKEVTENLFILPNELKYKGNVNTDTLHKGIYRVPVYNGTIKVSGNFIQADLSTLSLTEGQLMPEKASLVFGISDLKGLKTNPQIRMAGQTLTVTPVAGESVFPNSLKAQINLK